MIETLINSLPVFVVIGIGAYFKYKNLFSEEVVKALSKITFSIAIPFLIVKVLYGHKFTVDNLNLLFTPIIVVLIFIIIGIGLSKTFRLNKLQIGVLIPSIISFSIGSFAYPFILQNFSNELFSKIVLVDIVLFFLVLSVGYYIALVNSKNESSNWAFIFKKIFTNPIVISMVVVMIINYTGIVIPKFVLSVADFISAPFSFLTSFLLGLSLSFPSKKQFSVIMISTLVRMGAILLTLFLSYPTILSKSDFQTFSLAFLTPFASIPIIFAYEFDLDVELASQLSLFSKIVAIVVYPFVMAWVK